MKKYLFYFVLLGMIMPYLSGCTRSAIRYSPEELSSYPPAMQEHIKNGELVAGMTFQQVRYAWGAPSEINVISLSDDGKPREEWIYSRNLGVFKTRLIFVEGRLTVIISSDSGVVK